MNARSEMLLGKMLVNTLQFKNSLADVEFSVFSQFGDDGIIQYLINTIKPANDFFVEFGVENYLESNTRFLMQNNNWSGLVMDGSKANTDFIRQQDFYWKHDLLVKQSFITAENINELLSDTPESIGLLHIDIDGMDYWVWKAIEKKSIDIMIVEYNSVFGDERSVTVPYEPGFVRSKKHFSHLYAGASLPALCDLAEEKGYYFVGSNSAGNNAYFVQKGKAGSVKHLTAKEGYVLSKFRESRDKNGQLNYLRGDERLEAMKGLPVYNTRSNSIEKI
jgi:hypothetical protein